MDKSENVRFEMIKKYIFTVFMWDLLLSYQTVQDFVDPSIAGPGSWVVGSLKKRGRAELTHVVKEKLLLAMAWDCILRKGFTTKWISNKAYMEMLDSELLLNGYGVAKEQNHPQEYQLKRYSGYTFWSLSLFLFHRSTSQ